MSDNMFGWEIGADRVLVLTMDDPTQPTNTMTERCITDLRATVARLQAEKDSYDGVIITSAKDTFFAGGDLNLLMNAGPDDVVAISEGLDAYKECFRAIETLGKPVVAAINGTALGGGFEVALAAHHRIALDRKGSLLGLPEVTLGVLPGAGGVTRVVRMIGIVNAVLNVVGQGQRMKPAKALEVGIIDQVVATEDEMMAAAKTWIAANPDAAQPWDRKGYKIPGGTPASPALAANLPAFPANLRKQLKGSPIPAPISVLATAVEGAQVDIDTAFAIETRYCANLICGQVSTNMIKALFFDLNAINKGASRPAGFERRAAEKVAVLGAGMMGAAIAYVVAQSGAQVVLRDVSVEAAERGKDYSRALLDKAVAKGRITADKRDEVLARILATDDVADVKGADFVVEAVFEDLELKKKVFAEVEPYLADDALIATNTSALPLSEMVTAVSRPRDFIGLHFFSPVDRMPLLEIVVGEETGDEAVARAFDFAQQIRKTPIAVKDVYAFYANRVIGEFVDQAVSMLGEGAHPASIEQATAQAGFPTGALALLDEVNMRTTLKIQRGAVAAAEAEGRDYVTTPGTPIQERMVEELDRPGRLAGRGFYDYAEDGSRIGLWPGLLEHHHRPEVEIPFEDMKERLLVAAALEAARCLETGIVRTVADANIGSIMGIGYPAWTGGTLQYVNGYQGPLGNGPAGFVARADELRARYGDRFVVPPGLRELAATDRCYL
ncbi:3-hydroxyacyl-CoA dehydrogenase NAD-binding domain-containing protein [Nocardioides caeni]|uniref:3-hydroxyacyl-CoA dehydrogenase n=1 Tax=Nocardioides caeni TaxID=574700 RepID=A0A4S8N399_9ACTN|nr:3-hydroxyacyl-CoA dehydrogenase NAD-binding domain-containing protein [Nocardioides caeni]THV10493.1 3-hydroxyacyl-CoA dehydrogenase [Nocardioides caeni]